MPAPSPISRVVAAWKPRAANAARAARRSRREDSHSMSTQSPAGFAPAASTGGLRRRLAAGMPGVWRLDRLKTRLRRGVIKRLLGDQLWANRDKPASSGPGKRTIGRARVREE